MSLVISSTTDTQKQVNAAAGIEAPPVEEQKAPPGGTPPEQPPLDPAEDDEPEDDGEDDGEDTETEEKPEETQPPAKPRKGGYLRRIEKLERENGYLQRRLEEQSLAGQRRPAEETQPQRPQGKPQQDQYASYEEYVEALTDWKVDQREAQNLERARHWQAQEQQRQTQTSWQQRVGEFKRSADDFDDVLASTDHIQVPPALQQAIMESELGPQLAYELAHDPAELQRIASLSPLAAARELGRLEQRIAKPPEQKKQPQTQISRAPAPITPVARGANGTGPRTLEDAPDFQSFKRMREAQIAARRKAARGA